MADTTPSTSPLQPGRRRWASTMASSRKATTGMSSPPVASGRAAVGRMARNCRVRSFPSRGPRQSRSATATTRRVTTLKRMRASLNPIGCLALAGRPKTAMSGRYGKNDS